MSTTYTVAVLDKNGNPATYLRPNYLDPAAALKRLKDEKRRRPLDTIRVMSLSHDLLDEADLLQEMGQDVKD